MSEGKSSYQALPSQQIRSSTKMSSIWRQNPNNSETKSGNWSHKKSNFFFRRRVGAGSLKSKPCSATPANFGLMRDGSCIQFLHQLTQSCIILSPIRRRMMQDWGGIEAGFTKNSFRLCMPSCFFLLLLVSNINTADNLPSSGFIAWTRAFWSTLVTLWRLLFHLPFSFQMQL